MQKRFKTKKKISLRKTKYLFYFFIVLFISIYTFQYISHLKFANNNQEFVKFLLEDSNHYKVYNSQGKKVIYKISQFLTGFNVNNPASLVENTFIFKNNKTQNQKIVYKEEKEKTPVLNQKKESEETKKETSTDVKKPSIYIYSTHQTEGYADKNLSDFNISPDVMMAAYLLQDRLQKLGATVYVEERKMSEYLKQNNLDYNMSYNASRYYATDFLKNHPTIDLIIDLHRDALTKNLSTVTIKDKNYAKILFVLGAKASTYQSNQKVVNEIDQKIRDKYLGLSRGSLVRDYSIYNQDLSDHSILLELGGNENTVDEVMNTVDALAPIFYEWVSEKHG